MAFENFKRSYTSKLGFYAFVFLLPPALMTLVEIVMPGSFLSVTSDDPSKFLFFLVYFLPGIIMARSTTDSWRRTIGVGIGYMLLAAPYYLFAAKLACDLGSRGCLNV